MRKEIVICLVFLLTYVSATNDEKSNKRKSWRDKDIRDMNDADLEHLLDQWEVRGIFFRFYVCILKKINRKLQFLS